MATLIRPEVSQRNKYWIDRHRHYELKHFCLQYPLWKSSYAELNNLKVAVPSMDGVSSSNIPGDPTASYVMMKIYYEDKIDLIERTAKEADDELYPYLLKAVTEGLSYTYLRTKLNIPCGRDMYYDRYRRFFWLLSNARD